jgi:site-specific recombinase XerD
MNMQIQYKFDDLLELFRDYLCAGNYSKSTIKCYISDVRLFLNWYSYVEKTGELKHDKVAQSASSYLEYVGNQLYAAGSLRKYASAIQRFLEFMFRRGFIDEQVQVVESAPRHSSARRLETSFQIFLENSENSNSKTKNEDLLLFIKKYI